MAVRPGRAAPAPGSGQTQAPGSSLVTQTNYSQVTSEASLRGRKFPLFAGIFVLATCAIAVALLAVRARRRRVGPARATDYGQRTVRQHQGQV